MSFVQFRPFVVFILSATFVMVVGFLLTQRSFTLTAALWIALFSLLGGSLVAFFWVGFCRKAARWGIGLWARPFVFLAFAAMVAFPIYLVLAYLGQLFLFLMVPIVLAHLILLGGYCAVFLEWRQIRKQRGRPENSSRAAQQ